MSTTDITGPGRVSTPPRTWKRQGRLLPWSKPAPLSPSLATAPVQEGTPA